MQPFAGLKVIDLSHVLAGPFAAYQLAVHGAEVIKVENPSDPDMARNQGASRALNDRGLGTNFLTQASNKKAITLNLKTPEGREILKKLVADADALVENFRPGALAELGLGYDALSAINDRLVYCSISGFGQDGPRSRQRAYDHVIQALSGMMALNGDDRTSPQRVGFPFIDYATGTMAAFALSAALLQRERSGCGQHIDLAMLDVALMMMSSAVTGYLNTGITPKPPGNSHALSGNGCFPAKEGMIMLGANDRGQHTGLFNAIGRADIAGRDSWNDRLDNAAEEKAVLAETMLTRTAAEWEDYLQSKKVPAGRVRGLEESLADPQVGSRGIFHTHAESDVFRDPVNVPVSAFRLAHDGARIDTPPPELGQHTDDVLRQLGYDAERIVELRRAGVV